MVRARYVNEVKMEGVTAGILVYSAVEVLGLHKVDIILSMCKVLVVDNLPRVARSRRAALGKVMYAIYW
jgi:hypothetical protein